MGRVKLSYRTVRNVWQSRNNIIITLQSVSHRKLWKAASNQSAGRCVASLVGHPEQHPEHGTQHMRYKVWPVFVPLLFHSLHTTYTTYTWMVCVYSITSVQCTSKSRTQMLSNKNFPFPDFCQHGFSLTLHVSTCKGTWHRKRIDRYITHDTDHYMLMSWNAFNSVFHLLLISKCNSHTYCELVGGVEAEPAWR